MTSHGRGYLLQRVLMAIFVIALVPCPVSSGGPEPYEVNLPHKISAEQPSKSVGSVALVKCTEPRPQMCTMDYRPVCAELAGGGAKTFSNGCSACSDAKVTGYRDGVCAQN